MLLAQNSQSPLHWATKRGHKAVIETMVKHIEKLNKIQSTNNNVSTFDELRVSLLHGRDADGKTVRDVARDNEIKELLDVLDTIMIEKKNLKAESIQETVPASDHVIIPDLDIHNSANSVHIINSNQYLRGIQSGNYLLETEPIRRSSNFNQFSLVIVMILLLFSYVMRRAKK